MASLRIGIVGLPNVGKSTLFNALTKKQSAQASNFPFTTIDPNVGIVDLPDRRLEQLAAIVHPERIVSATVTFVDIAGLVRGAHKGEGLGNQFLTHIRDVDAIALVLRQFADPNVTHVSGTIDPVADAATIETELALKDLETIEKRLGTLEGELKAGSKEASLLKSVLEQAKTLVGQGRPVRELTLSPPETKLLQSLQLLTAKPLVYVLNVNESEVATIGDRIGLPADTAHQVLQAGELDVLPICAKVEAELASLSPAEGAEYLGTLGLSEPGLNRLIREAFRLLGLQTFFTAGPKEVRAWTIPVGATAPQAAGVIHTDFEHGFIRAEVIAFADYIAHEGEAGARTAGKLRSEGKDYVVADGDVVHFRFNV